MSKKTIVNFVIFWGGLILVNQWWQKSHPSLGFFKDFIDWRNDVFWVSSVLFFLFIQFLVNKLFFSEQAILEELAACESKTNESLPLQIDEYTKLVAVKSGPGKKFTFRHELIVSEFSNIKEVRRLLEKNITERWEIDDNKLVKGFFENGVEIVYIFFDSNGVELFSIERKK